MRSNRYAEQAALLDPKAYHYITNGFDVTVPEGHPWYVVNAWEVESATGRWFHRKLGVEAAMMLPPGTRIKSTIPESFLYYADPQTVIMQDARYIFSAKWLYFERLEQLRSMTLYELTAARPAGTLPAVLTAVAFPNDFNYGLIAHVSVMDLCWIIMAGGMYQGSQIMRASNCLDEINDVHLNRFTSKIIQPFQNGEFPGNAGCQWNGIWCGHGIEGDVSGYPQTRDGAGTLHYYKLPDTW